MGDLGIILWILTAPLVIVLAFIVSVLVYCYALLIYPLFAVVSLLYVIIGKADKAKKVMLFWYESYRKALGKEGKK